MRALISLAFTIAGVIALAFSIRHGLPAGVIIGGIALFGGWWTIEGREVKT